MVNSYIKNPQTGGVKKSALESLFVLFDYLQLIIEKL